MTLLTTEIHRAAKGDVIVFAADRRITRAQVQDSRQRVFPIPGCHAGIGYFGLAEVCLSGSSQHMSEWLQDLFYEIRPDTSPADVAGLLCERVNVAVPSEWRNSEPSGFHVAGLGSDGLAEFWFVRNLDDDGNLTHRAYESREDFKSRDGPALPAHAVQIYRNGDVRAHVVAWEQIDMSLGTLLGQPSFLALTSTADYVDWVKFKMELVAQFYERFAVASIIGAPIDAFAIHAGV